MKTRIVLSCLLMVVSVFYSPSFAQVETASWPTVRFKIFALDAKGDPLQGLAAADLILKEDGHLQKITGIAKVSGPESVCILVDSSGSMYDRVESTKAALIRLIKALPAEDEVCLADFSALSFLDQKFTADHAAVIENLKFLKASGLTALYDAVIAMTRYMRSSARYLSRTLVLISDGDDNASKSKKGGMFAELRTVGSPVVDVFRLPALGDSHNWFAERWTSDAARISGGLSYSPTETKEIGTAIDNFIAAWNGRYFVEFQTDRTTPDGKLRNLAVSLAKSKKQEKVEIRAPEGYYAPSK